MGPLSLGEGLLSLPGVWVGVTAVEFSPDPAVGLAFGGGEGGGWEGGGEGTERGGGGGGLAIGGGGATALELELGLVELPLVGIDDGAGGDGEGEGVLAMEEEFLPSLESPFLVSFSSSSLAPEGAAAVEFGLDFEPELVEFDIFLENAKELDQNPIFFIRINCWSLPSYSISNTGCAR